MKTSLCGQNNVMPLSKSQPGQAGIEYLLNLSRSANACAAYMPRDALSFLNRQYSKNIQYSIDNIQSFDDGENIPIQFFTTKCSKIIHELLKTACCN